VATPTSEQVVMAAENDTFCSYLNQSTINLPDTVGVWWASRLLGMRKSGGARVSERMAGVDVAEALLQEARLRTKNVLLVGGKGKTAERAAENLRRKYPGLGVWGVEGVERVESIREEEVERLVKLIGEREVSVVLIGLGAPWQEQLMVENRRRWEAAGVRIVMVVGGAIDVWAGNVVRAPVYMRKIGLEWLWRLGAQPWRWRRQLGLVKFVQMVTVDGLKK
jgi:N-acetylglucosaminyldiphosphoundecaprenol N-acetyl-beta-D-mannosaminyltransferase